MNKFLFICQLSAPEGRWVFSTSGHTGSRCPKLPAYREPQSELVKVLPKKPGKRNTKPAQLSFMFGEV